jgi:phosphoribosylformimino-5-aminoimidazole carboxamide ribotide isomerase
LEVIPVIDLKSKQVVRAKMGERHLYAPIKTPLAAASAPRDVIAGFLSLHPFRTIYIADLDAIEGRETHRGMIRDLQTEFPHLDVWIDPGVKSVPDARAWLTFDKVHLVVGSETWQDADQLTQLRGDPRVILSLDFRGAIFQGRPALLNNENLWPRRLIVMTLARVGSDAGPDLERLKTIIERAKPSAVYAAGGLRGKDDLGLLRETGAAGVLVASALHDGRLSHADLIEPAKKGSPKAPLVTKAG